MRASGIVLAALAALTAMATLGVANAAASTETIVFVRHGEKPDQGLGQLSCKGLNRALALPSALARFGRPTAIFAPDPADKKADLGTRYSYVRPLATIEPTAIRLGMPVDTTFGISTTDRLIERLWQGEFADSTVFVAWEHRQIEAMAKALVASHFGDVAVVPEWNGDDFDSVYIVRIDRPAVTCGSNGGSAAPCPSPVSVNGACGSSPHTCFAGYPIGFNDNGAMATWTCGGGNGGASASCSAAAPVNAACGGSPDSCSPGSPSGRNDSGTTGTRVGAPRVSFEKASEGLNGLSDACPAVGGRAR
jgi:hypothetical protein